MPGSVRTTASLTNTAPPSLTNPDSNLVRFNLVWHFVRSPVFELKPCPPMKYKRAQREGRFRASPVMKHELKTMFLRISF